MQTKYKLLYIITPSVFVMDQLTKLIVIGRLDVGSRNPVIQGFFDLVHFQNTGAAFGLFSRTEESFRVPFFYIIAVVATVLLALFYKALDERERLVPLALSLVFGGIAGNVLDRIRLGSVVDFLSFHIGNSSLDFQFTGSHIHIPLEWPAFNIADSAITVAMVLLLYSVLFRKKCA